MSDSEAPRYTGGLLDLQSLEIHDMEFSNMISVVVRWSNSTSYGFCLVSEMRTMLDAIFLARQTLLSGVKPEEGGDI